MSKAKKKLSAYIGLVLGFGLTLTGCSNPIDSLVNKGIEKAVGSAIGADISFDTGDGASLPKDWPNIPTPKTKPAFSMKVPGGYTAGFLISEKEVAELIKAFEKAGYETGTDANFGEAELYSFVSDNYNVGLMIAPEDGGQFLVSYTVTEPDQED